MKQYYRVCHKQTQQGLWYCPKGEFTGLIHMKFKFCQNNQLMMPFDEDLRGWLSATDSLETLYNWFSREDILRLQNYDYYIHLYDVQDVKFYEKHQHYVIKQNTSKVSGIIELIKT